MWRWQSIQEFQYPLIEYLNALKGLPLFLGIETVVPGHEHTLDVGHHGADPVVARHGDAADRRRPYVAGSATPTALAQWEYCFDRADTDTSRGARQQQLGLLRPGQRERRRSRAGTPTAQKLIPASGAGTGTKGHLKTLEGAEVDGKPSTPTPATTCPPTSSAPASSTPTATTATTSSTLRDFNNTAPRTRVRHGDAARPRRLGEPRRVPGASQQHQRRASPTASAARPSAAPASTAASSAASGTRCSARVATSGSSPAPTGTTAAASVPTIAARRRTSSRVSTSATTRWCATAATSCGPQTIVDGLRSGNVFTTGGQLIDRLGFRGLHRQGRRRSCGELAANAAVNKTDVHRRRLRHDGREADGAVGLGHRRRRSRCATRRGRTSRRTRFANPSLLQVGINQPINMPVLDHIDLIGGLVTGYRTPGAPDYAGEWPRNTAWLRADGTTTGLVVGTGCRQEPHCGAPPHVQRQRRHALERGDLARRRHARS